jgi:Tfp pilus assembly protein PilE
MKRIRAQGGFTLVEVLVAALVLVIGIGAVAQTFNTARKLTLVSERQTSMAHRAQAELERIKSLPYSQIALTGPSSSWSSNAADYTYVSAPGGACPSAPSGAAPTYQPDHSQAGSTAWPLVINGCSYTLSGTQTTVTGGQLAPVTPWTDGRFSGNIYDFVTWYSDPTCSETSTPGSACPTSDDYKQVTIVVTLTGAAQPSHPAILSAFLPNPDQNSQQNLFTSGSTTCGTTNQPCTNTLSGTPLQYFLCDSSYSGSSCSPPPCTGNALHNTLVSVLGVAPAPDLLGSTLPTGSCTNGSGTPTPPCYGTNILTGCQGVPLVPTGNSTCGSAPANNSEAHSWVTPTIPSGTTLNLNGHGSLTTYIESASGVSVNATVCLGLYLVPGGLLGTLTGNLLSTPIGVVVSASATAQVGVPSPVSFDFNLGTADAITSPTLGVLGINLGLPRVEAVVWIAASASTDVQLAYDQAQFASQLTLVTS